MISKTKCVGCKLSTQCYKLKGIHNNYYICEECLKKATSHLKDENLYIDKRANTRHNRQLRVEELQDIINFKLNEIFYKNA